MLFLDKFEDTAIQFWFRNLGFGLLASVVIIFFMGIFTGYIHSPMLDTVNMMETQTQAMTALARQERRSTDAAAAAAQKLADDEHRHYASELHQLELIGVLLQRVCENTASRDPHQMSVCEHPEQWGWYAPQGRVDARKRSVAELTAAK